ncbi:unnamed protein product [marine sediment metagenome]|uniref:Uncharacterized protein n=1 Tax=marine sediment metagenome TaxID=412755 RepID=X0XIQ0_9ZZZZ
MNYSIETNIPFPQTSIISNKQGLVISPFSNKLKNIGNKRWKLKYKNKIFYKTNPELYRIILGTLGYSNPKTIISFSKNNRKYKFKAILRNMIYNTQHNLKNNKTTKHYLVFYLDPINKNININFKKVNKLNLTFNNKILKSPRFQYGYCDNDRWKSCKPIDYLGKTKYYQGHIQDISFCKVYDNRKGPFNMYCALST